MLNNPFLSHILHGELRGRKLHVNQEHPSLFQLMPKQQQVNFQLLQVTSYAQVAIFTCMIFFCQKKKKKKKKKNLNSAWFWFDEKQLLQQFWVFILNQGTVVQGMASIHHNLKSTCIFTFQMKQCFLQIVSFHKITLYSSPSHFCSVPSLVVCKKLFQNWILHVLFTWCEWVTDWLTMRSSSACLVKCGTLPSYKNISVLQVDRGLPYRPKVQQTRDIDQGSYMLIDRRSIDQRSYKPKGQ